MECLAVNALLSRNNIQKIDLLQIVMRNKAARDSYHIRWLPTETVIGHGALGAILFLSQLPRIAKEAGDTEVGRS